MKKSELIASVVAKAGLSKVDAEKAYDAICDTIHTAMKAGPGSKVTLYGIGTFRNFRSKARNGRNPATGESILIPAKNYVKFSSSEALDKTVNP